VTIRRATCAAGDEQNHYHAGESWRYSHEDDERIDEGGELCHQDEIDQQHGNDESDSELLKRAVHADHSPSYFEHRVSVGLRAGNQLVDMASDSLKRLTLGRDINIDDTPDLIVIDFGRSVD
jgi:hypothetical protein